METTRSVCRKARDAASSEGPGVCARLFVASALLMGGCNGFMPKIEEATRSRAQDVAASYRPRGERPTLPDLNKSSSLGTILQYAILNSPSVEASYYDWISSVEHITAARSLPDPRLTFEADIQRVVVSLMPGLMTDIPGPGKLEARARVAAGESDMKYEAFRDSVLRTAAEVKAAYYELQAIEGSIRVNKNVLAIVRDLETVARAQNGAGKATLQDVLRAEIDHDELETKIRNLEDSRGAAKAKYLTALGVAQDAAIPLPARFENSQNPPNADDLLEAGLAGNPKLLAMRAEIRKAEAAVTLAHRSSIPDFSAGAEVDVKPGTPIVNPQLSLTLPIWRDKIAAEIAAANADKRSAEAKLSRETLMLASEFAGMAFMYRESERELRLLEGKLLPKARKSIELARSGYIGGMSSFVDFNGASRTLLQYELNYVEARKNREVALANLSLSVGGILPAHVAIGSWDFAGSDKPKDEANHAK